MHAIIEGHADQRAQIKEEERVITKNAGKLIIFYYDYLTEPMKSKPQRGENVGKYGKEIFWRKSRKDSFLATGKTLRKSFICQILKIDFSSEKRWLRVFEIGMNFLEILF